jgi:hypothetical protein
MSVRVKKPPVKWEEGEKHPPMARCVPALGVFGMICRVETVGTVCVRSNELKSLRMNNLLERE